MKTLVVYDSFFGNTEKVALAIRTALGGPEQVEAVRAGEVKPEQLKEVGLLVVGSPTRAFSPSKATTEFLTGLPSNGLKGVKAAVFDTRMDVAKAPRLLAIMVRLFGYAAQRIAAKLVKKGASLALPPEGFFVKDSEGPLEDDELERAAAWALSIHN